MSQRPWFKIFAKRWLEGSLKHESLPFRGVWVSLLCISSDSKYGDIGYIALGDNVGYTDKQIAQILNISIQKWVYYKRGLAEKEMITVMANNVIKINNWVQYQSEYQRQKGYRVKLQHKVTSHNTPQSNSQEVEVEVEEEKKVTTKVSPFNPKAGDAVKRQPEYPCKFCAAKYNKPTSHFYNDPKTQDCYEKVMKERAKPTDPEPF